MSLTQRLFGLMALAFVPAGLVLLVFSSDLKTARDREVFEAAVLQTQRATSEMERLVESMRTLLIAISTAPIVRDFNEPACEAYLNALANRLPHLSIIAVLDPHGDARCLNKPGARKMNYADRHYFQEALRTGDFVVGVFTQSRLEPERRVLPFALPIRDAAGTVTGVVALGLDLAFLNEVVGRWSLPAGGGLTIADREGVILARNPRPDDFVGQRIPEPYLRWVTGSEPGTAEIMSQDGTRRIQSYKPATVSPVGLYVSSGLSAVTVYEALADARRRGFYALAAAAVAAFGVVLLVAQVSIRRPVQDLVQLADAWRRGDPVGQPASQTAAEFATIAAALNRMGEGLRKQQAELVESGERLRTMVRRAPVALMLHAEDGEILEISESWFRRSGYAVGAVGSASEWFRQALAGSGGEHDPAVVFPSEGREREVTTPSGETRYWEFATVALGSLSDGRALRLTAASDVTERHRAAQHQDLMVRELNHRVKNTLAVVQSIASQTIRPDGDPADMVVRFTERVSALSRTQDLLTQRQWSSIRLEDLLVAELTHLGLGDQVSLNGPDVEVPAELAVSTGLIVHELATNAAKYGAMSVPGGRVAVSWRLQAGEETTTVDLTWEETGGPAVTAPSRRGFGSRLIGQVSRSMGEGNLTFDSSGVVFSLRFNVPAKMLLEEPDPEVSTDRSRGFKIRT
ncbi:sensor histidine kinase [Chthonobacter albigriseus]|uniref:sensor histidine kinase n=1 Tax=Chthonobacter albigriseus TaxID=1683161 RepID=UPI0015EED6A9|nr:HWE histidine kinase domain-containing protein [Chthonobacter albigriseus]